jgi:hypothetical protein
MNEHEAHIYHEGYNNGYRKAKLRQHRYAWGKLLLGVYIASFLAFATVWALVTFL